MASKDIWRLFHRTSLLFGTRPCGSCSRLRVTPVMCCQSLCIVHPGKRPPSRWRSYRDLYPAVSFCQFHTSLRHNTHMDTNKYNLDNDCFRKYLEHLKAEYHTECAQIAGNELTVTERHVHLGGVVRKIDALYEKAAEKEDVSKLIAGLTEDDVEMKRLAKEEYEKCQKQMVELEEELVELVTPVISGDDTDVILEVTPGVGGQEAMLFAGEMFTMYQNYATTKGWDFQMVGVDRNEFGGVRRAAASISGEGVYGWLRFEGGVHRVQRVPQTEKSGRVHTSTVTVAILPQPTEIDITLNPKDLQVETCRASGKGGQHVNTTDSAVRIVHTPTGMFAECQTERSQIKNKETAMKVLKSRLYERSLSEQTSRQQQARKFQVGTAGRSEKIRTYNFNQDRVTDHRLNHSLHNIERVMMGGAELEALIQRLNHEARLELLEEKLSEVSSL